MIRAAIVAVFVAAACGKSSAPAPAEPAPPAPKKIGQHNAVCSLGQRHTQEPIEVFECAPGLSCCYPCGIKGCDSVCQTAEECDVERP